MTTSRIRLVSKFIKKEVEKLKKISCLKNFMNSGHCSRLMNMHCLNSKVVEFRDFFVGVAFIISFDYWICLQVMLQLYAPFLYNFFLYH